MKILIDVEVQAKALEAIRRTGADSVDCVSPPGETKRPLDADRIAEVEVLFCTYPPANLAAMKALRWIQISSSGYSQLFGLELPARGIRATNLRGCFDVPIAEWNLAMMVNLARNARQLIRNQEAAVWERAAMFQGELRGQTVGIWGYGGIGRETARLARAFGMKVLALTRNGVGPATDTYRVPGTGDPEGTLPDGVFRSGQEREFLGQLDFLIVAMPLTKATAGLIGEKELQALPRTAYLLNPARGPIIHEEALLRALREGWIAGAAIDTHYHYPMPPEHPLWRFPNVFFTPHIAGSNLSPHFPERLWDIFSLNLERYRTGAPLLNELTAAQLGEC